MANLDKSAAKETLAFPLPEWLKTVMNRPSPVSSRFPAPTSLSMRLPSDKVCEPSPKTVSIFTGSVLVHESASFGHHALPWIQLHLDELHLFANDLVIHPITGADWISRCMGAPRSRRAQLRHLRYRQPLGKSFPPGVALWILLCPVHCLVVVERADLIVVVAEVPLCHLVITPVMSRLQNSRAHCPGSRSALIMEPVFQAYKEHCNVAPPEGQGRPPNYPDHQKPRPPVEMIRSGFVPV